MNAVNRLVMFGLASMIVSAAACGARDECEVDRDCSAGSSCEQGICEVDVDPTDWSDPDAGDGKADNADGGMTSADTDGDAGTESDGGGPPRENLLFTGPVTLEGDGSYEGSVEIAPSVHGVLMVTFDDPGQFDPEALKIELCTAPFSCAGLAQMRRRAWMPPRALHELEPDSYTLKFSAFDSSLGQGSKEIRVSVQLLPFREVDASGESFADALELTTPSALRVSVEQAHPRWFEAQVDRPGVLTVHRLSSNDPYPCDMSTWRGMPGECRNTAAELGPAPTEAVIEQPGPAYVIAESTYADLHEFVVLFDADPNALVCPPNQHPGGDGTCVASSACAPAFHDGGWGACVPDDECAPKFVLRADGRCEGWVAEGALHVFNPTSETVLTPPGGDIFVAGLQWNASGDSVYAPQIWDPTSGAWADTAAVESSPVGTRQICPMSDGRFLTLRFGYFLELTTDSELIFDPADGSWQPVSNKSGISWKSPTCLLLQDGRTLVFEHAQAMLFEPSTETWSSAGTGPVGTRWSAATEPLPGVVISAAGNSGAQVSRGFWKWTAADSAWTRTADWMLAGELGHTVHTMSAGGDVILVRTEGDVLRYDPATDTFEQLGSIAGEVLGATIDGSKVFVTYQASQLRAGVFDLATGQLRELPAPPRKGRPVVVGSDYFIISGAPVRLHVAPL